MATKRYPRIDVVANRIAKHLDTVTCVLRDRSVSIGSVVLSEDRARDFLDALEGRAGARSGGEKHVTPLRDYPPPVLEAWATWEVMRQLGFSADDIFWIVVLTANARPRPGLALNVRLATQGRELLVTCSGALERDEAEALLQQGIEFGTRVNARAFPEDELTAVLHGSYIWKNKAAFLMVLLDKGF